jgi:hypothetical protein
MAGIQTAAQGGCYSLTVTRLQQKLEQETEMDDHNEDEALAHSEMRQALAIELYATVRRHTQCPHCAVKALLNIN